MVWRVLAILILANAVSILDRQLMSILAEPVRHDLKLGDFELSLLLGASFGLCYAVFGGPLGWLADRWSGRKTIALGLLVWSASTAATGLSTTFGAIFAFRMLVGVGEAALAPVAYPMIAAHVAPNRLSFAITAYNWAGAVGTAVSVALGGVLLQSFSAPEAAAALGAVGLRPWQAIFIVMAIPGLLLAPFTLKLPESRRARSSDAAVGRKGPAWLFLRTSFGFIGPCFLALGMVNLAVYSVLSWGPQYMVRVLHMRPAEVGGLFGIIVIAGPVLGGLASSMLADHLFSRGRRDAQMLVIFWLLVLALPLGVYGFLAGNATGFIIGITAFLFLAIPLISLGGAAVQVMTPPEVRGIYSGAYVGFLTVAGTIIGPSVVGGLTQFALQTPTALGGALAMVVGGATAIALPCAWAAGRSMRSAPAARP
jgi:MFS family permease